MSKSKSKRKSSSSSLNRDAGDEGKDMYFMNKIAEDAKFIPCGLVYEKFCEIKNEAGIEMSNIMLPVYLASVSVAGTIVGNIARTKIRQLYRNLTKEPLNIIYIAYYDSQHGEMFSFKTRESVYNKLSKSTVVDQQLQVYDGKMKPIEVKSTDRRKRKSSLSMLIEGDQTPNCFRIKLGVLQPGKQIAIKIAFISEVTRELGKGIFYYTIPNTFVPRFKLNKSTLDNEYYKAKDTFKNMTVDIPVSIYTIVTLQGDINYVSSSINEVVQDVNQYLAPDLTITSNVTRMNTLANTQVVEDFGFKYNYRPYKTPCIYRENYDGLYSHLVEFEMLNLATRKSDYEIIFFLDLSSSMAGKQYVLAKKAIMMLISEILPSLISDDQDSGECYFNICGFGNRVLKFSPCSVLARNKDNIDGAVAFINDCSPELGEPDLLEALNIMGESVQYERLKSMIIITEGWLMKNYDGIRELVKCYVDTRFHMIGVGHNISKYGISTIASEGRGQALFYKSNLQDIDIDSSLRYIIDLSLSCEQVGSTNTASWYQAEDCEVDEIKNYVHIKEFPSTRSFGGYLTSTSITTSPMKKFVYHVKTHDTSAEYAAEESEAEINPSIDYKKHKIISKYSKLKQMRNLEAKLEKYEYFQENDDSTRDATDKMRKQIIEISMTEGFPSHLTVIKPHLILENENGEETLCEKDIWRLQTDRSFPCPKFRTLIKAKKGSNLNSGSGSQILADLQNVDAYQSAKKVKFAEVEQEISSSNEEKTGENVQIGKINDEKLDASVAVQSKSEEITPVEIPEINTIEVDVDADVGIQSKSEEITPVEIPEINTIEVDVDAGNDRKELEENLKMHEPEPEPKAKKVKISLSKSEKTTGESNVVAMKKNCLNAFYKLQNRDGYFNCNDEFCQVFGSTKEELIKVRKRNCNATSWATVLAFTYAKMCVLENTKISQLLEKAQRWIGKNISPEKVHSIEEAAKEFIYQKLI